MDTWREKLMRKLGYIVPILCLVFIFCTCYTFYDLEIAKNKEFVEIEESTVMYNEEPYTFRDDNGKKQTLKYDKETDTLYVPISNKGILGKEIHIDKELHTVDIKDIEHKDAVDINCEVLEGGTFSNEDIALSDYTLLIYWATWCPACDKFFESFNADIIKDLEDNDIGVVGLIADDLRDTKTREEIAAKVIEKKQKWGIVFKNLVPNSELTNTFEQNVSSIPTVYILDKYSRVEDSLNLENNSLQDVVNRVKEIQATSCGEC